MTFFKSFEAIQIQSTGIRILMPQFNNICQKIIVCLVALIAVHGSYDCVAIGVHVDIQVAQIVRGVIAGCLVPFEYEFSESYKNCT